MCAASVLHNVFWTYVWDKCRISASVIAVARVLQRASCMWPACVLLVFESCVFLQHACDGMCCTYVLYTCHLRLVLSCFTYMTRIEHACYSYPTYMQHMCHLNSSIKNCCHGNQQQHVYRHIMLMLRSDSLYSAV